MVEFRFSFGISALYEPMVEVSFPFVISAFCKAVVEFRFSFGYLGLLRGNGRVQVFFCYIDPL